MSRSEFFARAANRYLDELDAGSVTRQIDDAVGRIGQAEESSEVAVEAGRRLLGDGLDEW